MLHCTLKFAWFWPLGALSLGPHGGHMYHMNDFESLAPKDDSCQVCFKSDQAISRSRWNSYFLHRAMRFELATRSVTSPDSENCAPLELQDSLTWKILALSYQKYTFSERKFHEEFKYGIQYDIGSGTKILWRKIFGFWGPQKWIFARSISHSPFDPISNSIEYLNSS